jgi:glutamyl-tRNA(Gln) amidotransferase subunit D
VYDTGRDILKAGAIEGEDLLPEVALVKLMWALGQTRDPDEVRKIMTTDISGEITRSSRTW